MDLFGFKYSDIMILPQFLSGVGWAYYTGSLLNSVLQICTVQGDPKKLVICISLDQKFSFSLSNVQINQKRDIEKMEKHLACNMF